MMQMNQNTLVQKDLVEVGTLIRMLRKRKKIKQTELFHGLCTKEVFERIEKGKGFTNELLIERLFSRLHMQSKLLDLTLSDIDFERKELRAQIELCVEKNQVTLIEELLYRYEMLEKQGKLDKQYILWTRARVKEFFNYLEAGKLYKQAFLMTGENVKRGLLSEEELDMYLGYRRCLKPLTREEQNNLLCWIEEEFFKYQVFPRSYFITKLAEAENNYIAGRIELAAEICTKCIEILNNKNMTSCLVEFLFLMAKCRKSLLEKDENVIYESFREVFYTCLAFGEDAMAEKVAVYCKEEMGWHIIDVVK